MKTAVWIIAGASIAFASYIILNTPGPRYATGNDDLEDAADRTSQWGSKQRLSGAGRSILGKAKQGIGRVTQDDELAGEGLGDQVVGAVKDAAGQVAQAAGQAAHELNR